MMTQTKGKKAKKRKQSAEFCSYSDKEYLKELEIRDPHLLDMVKRRVISKTRAKGAQACLDLESLAEERGLDEDELRDLLREQLECQIECFMADEFLHILRVYFVCEFAELRELIEKAAADKKARV